MANDTSKRHINLAIVGHVDAGKSTFSGQLLLLGGHVQPHEIAKNLKQAEELGKKSFEYAFVMDQLEEERKKGVTIALAHREFITPNREFTLVDCPGHATYTKNFIVGAAQADAVVLLIDASKGVEPQTVEHCKVVFNNKIKYILVAINKMDAVNWDEARYVACQEQVKRLFAKLLETINRDIQEDEIYTPIFVGFVPTSALQGHNLLQKSANTPWYTGQTIFELLDSLPYPLGKDTKPLRMQVSDVITKTGIGVVATGKVLCGVIKPGDKVIVKPGKTIAEVKSIEQHNKPLKEGRSNDNIGVVIRGLSKTDVKKGFIIAHVEGAPKAAIELHCTIMVVHAKSKLREGSDVSLHYGSGVVPAKIKTINKIKKANITLNRAEIEKVLQSGDVDESVMLTNNSIGEVVIIPAKTIVVEKAKDCPELGRFHLRSELGTVAFAVCDNYIPHPDEVK